MQINECGFGSNKTLFTNTELQILDDFHVL